MFYQVYLYEFTESLRIAIKALWANKLRSILTTLGIIIGVMTVIAIVSLIQGLNRTVYTQLSAIGTQTLYVQKFDFVITNFDEVLEMMKRKDMKIEYAEIIQEQCSAVEYATPTLNTHRKIKYKNKDMSGVGITGAGIHYQEVMASWIERGRFFLPPDIERKHNVCIVGLDVIKELFPNTDPLGKKIYIGKHRFTIIGIMEELGSIFGNSRDLQIYIPITTFQKVFGKYRSATIAVRVKDVALMETAKGQIRWSMRRVRKVRPDKKDDFSVNSQDMLLNLYKKLTKVIFIVMISVSSISLLVGGIGIMNIMLVSVTERTKEIGIRKAIGARRKDILIQFIIEALMLCAVGGILGVLFGAGIAKLVAKLSPLPAYVPPWSIVLGLGFSSIVGLIFGIYPAMRAAKLNPIDALRYE